MAFATQAEADGNWDCSRGVLELGLPPGATLKLQVDGQICPTQCNIMNKIYDNCYIDKMQGVSKVSTIFSVKRSCERIACKPTFFQKLKYK